MEKLNGDVAVVEKTSIAESRALPETLKWFTKLHESRQIDDSEELFVGPQISYLPADGNLYFRIHPSPTHGVELDTALLRLKTQLRRKDGSALEKDDNVSVISSPLLGMFKSVKVSLNGTTVGQTHNNHHNTVSFAVQELTKDSGEHFYYLGPTSLAIRDSGAVESNTIEGMIEDTRNEGLNMRARPFKESKTVELIGEIGHGKSSDYKEHTILRKESQKSHSRFFRLYADQQEDDTSRGGHRD